MYIFCIHIVNCIINFVYNLPTLYTFCIQNGYTNNTFLQIDTFSSGQEFSRVDPEYLQDGTRHEGMNGKVAQHLYNCGHEKLVEEPHRRSVWTVLPVNHILGKLLLALQILFHGGQRRMTIQLMSGGRSRWPATGDGINSTNFIVDMDTKFA